MSILTRLSRRKLLELGAAAIAATSGLAGESSASAQVSLRSGDRHVDTWTAKDPQFASKVGTLFPGIQDDPKFQMIMPLAILITQQSGPGIRAYSTCWSIATAHGVYETAVFKFAKPGAKRAGKGRAIASGQKNLLRPGQSVLITPFFMVSPAGYSRNSTAWHKSITPREPATFLASYPGDSSQKAVWIDAVVFKDRKVLGADKHHLKKRLRARRHAEHDAAHAVNKLLRSGASSPAIEEALLATATAPRSTAQGVEKWYAQAKKHHAQLLLKKLHSLDQVRFAKMVKRATKVKRTVLHRIQS